VINRLGLGSPQIAGGSGSRRGQDRPALARHFSSPVVSTILIPGKSGLSDLVLSDVNWDLLPREDLIEDLDDIMRQSALLLEPIDLRTVDQDVSIFGAERAMEDKSVRIFADEEEHIATGTTASLRIFKDPGPRPLDLLGEWPLRSITQFLTTEGAGDCQLPAWSGGDSPQN